MTYGEQLKDPRWLEIKVQILRRDNFTCVCCRKTNRRMNVHHGAYFKNKMAWEYESQYLHTVCDDCHKVAHDFIDSINEKIGFLNPDYLWDIEMCVMAIALGGSKELINTAVKIIRES
jgi:hypothetical protein